MDSLASHSLQTAAKGNNNVMENNQRLNLINIQYPQLKVGPFEGESVGGGGGGGGQVDEDFYVVESQLHKNKRQHDDYGHMRYGKRDFDDYGHMRFGR